MSPREKEYLSLKEASELTGYSSDYVGQLIRSGKIQGKQIYSHVSWVTTKEALDEYMSASGKVSRTPVRGAIDSYDKVAGVLSAITKITITISACFALLFGYVIAVSIDQYIETRALEKMEYVQ